MCCICPSDPVEDPSGKIKTFETDNRFQVDMMGAPCAGGCNTCCWCTGQFIPLTCGITQCCLRKKVLDGDMTQYQCCQGYFDCCCFKAGNCCESSCPDCCAFCEGCFCNSFAVSASRIVVQERFQLSSDPCDYQLIRCNNALQCLACICHLLAIFISEFRELARIVDCIANIFYHCISGCMTAQVAHEMNYQTAKALDAGENMTYVPPEVAKAQEYR